MPCAAHDWQSDTVINRHWPYEANIVPYELCRLNVVLSGDRVRWDIAAETESSQEVRQERFFVRHCQLLTVETGCHYSRAYIRNPTYRPMMQLDYNRHHSLGGNRVTIGSRTIEIQTVGNSQHFWKSWNMLAVGSVGFNSIFTSQSIYVGFVSTNESG